MTGSGTLRFRSATESGSLDLPTARAVVWLYRPNLLLTMDSIWDLMLPESSGPIALSRCNVCIIQGGVSIASAILPISQIACSSQLVRLRPPSGI